MIVIAVAFENVVTLQGLADAVGVGVMVAVGVGDGVGVGVGAAALEPPQPIAMVKSAQARKAPQVLSMKLDLF